MDRIGVNHDEMWGTQDGFFLSASRLLLLARGSCAPQGHPWKSGDPFRASDLSLLMRLTAPGPDLKIDTAKIVTTLLKSQLLPPAIGLSIRSRHPRLAERLRKPSNALTGILSVVAFTLIIALQSRTLADIRARGYVGICALVLLCLAAGWISGTPSIEVRKAAGLTTGARNVGVALVIATASFPTTAAVTVVIVFAIAQTVLLALVALLLGRLTRTARQV